MSITTIRCCLCVDKATRKFFWEAMVSYTLLINHLFKAVALQEQFQDWQLQGFVPRQSIKPLIEAFERESANQIPNIFSTSAVLMTQYVYKAWFKQQKKRRLRLLGKKRWLEAVESDDELAQQTDFSLGVICAKAQEILNQANTPTAQTGKKQGRDRKLGGNLIGLLLNQFEATDNLLEKRAIIHLLKHNLTVSEQDKDPAILTQQIESKKIEIERLEEQLQSQLPKGRDPTGERYRESLLSAIALPQQDEPDSIEAELAAWQEQRQVELFNDLPYPIIFGSADNLIWSLETSTITSSDVNISSETSSPKIKKRKKKKRQVTERICVRFKGLKDFVFKIQCDRRQLPVFRQFLTDYQFHFQTPAEERFSQSLFVLQTAQLMWRPDTSHRHHNGGPAANPWDTHRLYLHCNIDTRLLTAEGTGQARQQEKQKTLKNLKGRETLAAEELQALDLTDAQKSYLKRQQSTLTRLDNPTPPRPSVALYQGNSFITVGISLSLQTPLTACVVDMATGEILDCRTTKQFLTTHKVNQKSNRRSMLQLKLEQWRLVNKLHLQRLRNLQKQSEEQKQGQYRENCSESNLGLYVERLLASKLVRLALKWQAGSIAVPDMKHIREIIESELQAKARRKCPHQKERQDQYAKQFRRTLHRWSYSRLIECIRNLAAKEGILVITGQQPTQGELRQKAKQVAMSAHVL